MSYSRKAVAKNLQLLRKEAGFKSAKAFAEYIGMNPNTYTDYEQANRPLSYERAWQLADALHVTLDELAGRKFEQPTDATEAELVSCYRSATQAEKSALLHVARTYQSDGQALNNQVSA